MPAGGAESGAAARGEGGGLPVSAARLRQEARYPQVEVTSTRDSIAPQERPTGTEH